jgi:hypothetical protein
MKEGDRGNNKLREVNLKEKQGKIAERKRTGGVLGEKEVRKKNKLN